MVNDRPRAKIIAFLFLLVLVSCIASYFIAQWTANDEDWRHDHQRGHDWLREELELDDKAYAAINQLEPTYRSQRENLLGDFKAEIKDLQALLLTEEEYSPELNEAIHDLHIVHGQLQELSIRHYFDMLKVLPPEKQTRLREIAAKALSQPE